MEDQTFVSNDTYQADPDAGSHFGIAKMSASGRWQTTNSSNTMELERHLSTSSFSRNNPASSDASQRIDKRGRPDPTSMMSTYSEDQTYEKDFAKSTSNSVRDFDEQIESAASMPGQSPSHFLSDNGNDSVKEDYYDSNKRLESESMVLIPSLEPSLIGPRASEDSDHPYGNSKPQELENPVPTGNADQKREESCKNTSIGQHRVADEQIESTHPLSIGFERRGRTPSPRPRVSAETKARWAMLKQLAGVSQPHDVKGLDQSKVSDEGTRTTETEIRVREYATVRNSSGTDDGADDASIERYLQKLQGDPNIDSRGLQEGLSRMHSYKSSNREQDQNIGKESSFESDAHSSARALGDDTQVNGVDNVVRQGEQDARDIFHKGERKAERAFTRREAALRRDAHALGAGFEKAGRRAEGELISDSREAREHIPKDKRGIERDIQKIADGADADMHILGAQTAQELRKAEHGPEAGLQGEANEARDSLPHTNVSQGLRRDEGELVKGLHKADNAFSRTKLGLKVERGELSLMGKVHNFEHELSRIGPGQAIQKGKADLAGDIHKVEKELANTGLGQAIGKGDHHLSSNELRKLEQELPHLGLGRDFAREEHDLKHGLQGAADHLRRYEQAFGRGAEAAGRSVEHGLEHIGKKIAAEGAATAGGLGTMALGHAGFKDSASSPRPNILQPGSGKINPKSQQIPSTTRQPGAGVSHPQEAPGSRPATNDRKPNRPPANDQNRPSVVEQPRHNAGPQTSQPGHSRGPSGSWQPHLSPIPSQARTSPPRPAINEGPLGRMPSPSLGSNRSRQAPISKPVLLPRAQGSPQQRPSSASPPHSQPQRPQGAPLHPPQLQRPGEAQQQPPRPQNPQDAQLRAPHTTSTQPHFSHPKGVQQHRQNTVPHYPSPQHPLNTLQHPPNAIAQHPQAPHLPRGPQQSRPASAMHLHAQARRPQEAPKQISQVRMPPDTQPRQSQGPPQQRSQKPMSPFPQISHPPGASQPNSTSAMSHSQPQKLEAATQSTPPNYQMKAEVQQPVEVDNSNFQKGEQTMPGHTARLHRARHPPPSGDAAKLEGKTDEEEPRESNMQESRKPVESQSQLAKLQEQENGNDSRQGAYEEGSFPHQTERHSFTERVTEPGVISGPQSMLNMFKARADAAIEASGDSPSFTDQMVQLLCNMAQDAMPEIERRLAQNQRQGWT